MPGSYIYLYVDVEMRVHEFNAKLGISHSVQNTSMSRPIEGECTLHFHGVPTHKLNPCKMDKQAYDSHRSSSIALSSRKRFSTAGFQGVEFAWRRSIRGFVGEVENLARSAGCLPRLGSGMKSGGRKA